MMAPPDVNPHIKAQGKDVHWYKADHDNVSEPARQLLESYSGLSPDQVIQHISQIVSHQDLYFTQEKSRMVAAMAE